MLISVSQIIINSQMAEYGDMAIAGMGVAMQVIIIAGMVCMELGQDVQPLLGYCVGAKLWERFMDIFKFSTLFALLLGVILTVIFRRLCTMQADLYMCGQIPDSYHSYAIYRASLNVLFCLSVTLPHYVFPHPSVVWTKMT